MHCSAAAASGPRLRRVSAMLCSMDAAEYGLAREAVFAEIEASLGPDEQFLWAGIPRSGAHHNPGSVRPTLLFTPMFVCGAVAVMSLMSGSISMTGLMAAGAFVVLAALLVRSVPARRRHARTMVYGVTTRRVIGRSPNGYSFERPVEGLPVTYVRFGHLTTVSFAPPLPIAVNGTRLRLGSGAAFHAVVDDGGQMLAALRRAGAGPFVNVNR